MVDWHYALDVDYDPDESLGITTTLSYSKDDSTRPYFYARERTDGDPHDTDFGGASEELEVFVCNARSQGLTLDVNSFELVPHHTSLQTEDFYTPENWKIEEVHLGAATPPNCGIHTPGLLVPIHSPTIHD